MDARRILVTGGGGFIGHHLTRRLVEQGLEVRVLDNFATGRRERIDGLDISLVEGDLRSYERAHTAVRGVDIVFHLAALPSVPRSVGDPLTTNASNIEGTLNILLASRDEAIRRVVFASSSSVYGANPELPKREDHVPLPLSPYGVSKLAAEHYCQAFHSVYGLDAVALQAFQRLRSRPRPTLSIRGRRTAFHHGNARWALADRLRRRLPDARFHVRRRRPRRLSPRSRHAGDWGRRFQRLRRQARHRF